MSCTAGGRAPLAAALAVAAGALDGDRTVATHEGADVAGGGAGELLAAHRAGGRGGVGFGLRAAFDGLAEEFLGVVSHLHFQMAEVLVAGQGEALDGLLQGTGRTRGQHRQRFGHNGNGQGVSNTIRADRFHAQSLQPLARN